MFEGIDDIDWKALGDSRIPKLIRNLLSVERGTAHGLLDEILTISEAGFDNVNLGYGISKVLKSDLQLQAVPFLLEALEYDADCKPQIYDLLHSLAEFVDFSNHGKIYHDRAWQIRKAIWRGKDGFIRDLKRDNQRIRSNAFPLLAHFNEYSHELASILLEAIENETYKDVNTNTDLKVYFSAVFYHAFIEHNLLSETQLEKWNSIIPVPENELLRPLLKYVYTKHEIPKNDL